MIAVPFISPVETQPIIDTTTNGCYRRYPAVGSSDLKGRNPPVAADPLSIQLRPPSTLSGPSLQSATMASGAPLPALPDRQARRRGAGKRLSQTAGSETQQFLSVC